MGREEKEIPTMLSPESQPTLKNGISSINSGTLEKDLAQENDLSSTGMVWPLWRAVHG